MFHAMFHAAVKPYAAMGARYVFAADIDGDDDMDVLSASQKDDKIAWYQNDGSEGFTFHLISSSAISSPCSPVSAAASGTPARWPKPRARGVTP